MLSVYVHIPFCVQKCRYCDFLSFPASESVKDTYMQALLEEIVKEAPQYRDYVVDTVFIGGGTPSVLDGVWIEKILCKLKESFFFSDRPEITIEVNPGSADEEKLFLYRQAGINRLSIGTQSVQERELRLLGRVHNREDFFTTFRLARSVGYDNINVDLMAALPGQTKELYLDTLRTVTDLRPEHISAYSLIIEERTPFYELYGEGKQPHAGVPALPDEDATPTGDSRGYMTSAGMPALPDEDVDREMDQEAERFLAGLGYDRYEISNYALPGRSCRHNIAYWKRYDYVGFGLGASSMVANVRFKNTEDMESYVNYFSNKENAENRNEIQLRQEVQRLSIREQMEEFMFLGLRMTEGVSRAEFARTFGKELEDIYADTLSGLYRDGLLTGTERVRLTPYGRDISNYVMAQFL